MEVRTVRRAQFFVARILVGTVLAYFPTVTGDAGATAIALVFARPRKGLGLRLRLGRHCTALAFVGRWVLGVRLLHFGKFANIFGEAGTQEYVPYEQSGPRASRHNCLCGSSDGQIVVGNNRQCHCRCQIPSDLLQGYKGIKPETQQLVTNLNVEKNNHGSGSANCLERQVDV